MIKSANFIVNILCFRHCKKYMMEILNLIQCLILFILNGNQIVIEIGFLLRVILSVELIILDFGFPLSILCNKFIGLL